ncbi:MAG: hypothetical protein IANPNBLG_04722 [Bryobacteraceae bacterium]|nr:hypothetical protein [Bryobacteraceae bacterium]
MRSTSKKARILIIGILAACLAAAIFAFSRPTVSPTPLSQRSWNPKAAAAYLDQRALWWSKWPASARGDGTFCISCHTALSYSLSRPALRATLGEDAPTLQEQAIWNSVANRVRNWKSAVPYYGGSQTDLARSAGAESVVNAIVLARRDAANGKLSDVTRAAFDNMWALQQTTGDLKGAWWWLQFNHEPWEASDSQYYGAALAAIATSIAPESYHSNPGIQTHREMLREYLRREYRKQSLLNQVTLLWASLKWPELITPDQRDTIIQEVLDKQHTDGGWNLASLSWTWRNWNAFARMWFVSEGTPLKARSDGFATAFMTFVLQQAGLPRDNPRLRQGLVWLAHNQDQTGGQWVTYSLNYRRSLTSDTGRFMSDAATAYAVLSLSKAD